MSEYPEFDRWTWTLIDYQGRYLILDRCLLDRCPVCGILLQPDPEPLPVPEGCVRVEKLRFTKDGEVMILASGDDGERWTLRGKDAEAESAWRRAFGKETK